MVADYPTHSGATAEKHYHVRTVGHAVTAAGIVMRIGWSSRTTRSTARSATSVMRN